MRPSIACAAVVLFCLVACGGKQAEVEDVARDITLTAAGLYDNPNPLSQVPDGAFSRADDVVIRRPGYVETRRGFAPLSGTVGVGTDRIDAFADFAGTLIAHTTSGVIARYTGTAWQPYTGTYQPPAGRRMRFLSLAGSLYFTTSKGVYRLDGVTEQIVPAGVPQALAGSAVTTGSTGFLPDNSATAYRVVWGYRNANERLILGAPSSRMTVRNGSVLVTGASKNVTVTVPVPSWVTTDHFIQLYRADSTASSDIVPGDDLSLVYEKYPTAAEITAGTLSISDVAVDEQKGAFLYSSVNAGVAGSEKFQPPVCRDLEMYKERAWGFCTTQRQRMPLTLLSVDANSGGMRDGDTLIFSTQNSIEVFEAATTENAAQRKFQRFTDGTPAQNIARTATSLVKVVNAVNGSLTAQYTSTEYSEPGSLLFEAKTLGESPFSVFLGAGSSSYFSPAFNYSIQTTLQRTGGVVTATTLNARPHGFTAGQVVELSSLINTQDSDTWPLGRKTIASVPSSTTFTYSEAGPNAAMTGNQIAAFATTNPPLFSSSDEAPNGLFFGEYSEGADAGPLANYLPIGSANGVGLRVKALGSSLLLFKDDGTYVLNGSDPATFKPDKHPSSAKLVAPDSVQTLGTSIFALTDQGVMAYSESSSKIISGPIEGPIKDLIAGDPALAATVRNVAFSASYESEREYWLFLPTLATDTGATQAYVFNATTGTWVHWTLSATAAYVLPGQDKAYLGAPGTNGALVERKMRLGSDYQDADGVAIIGYVDWAVRTGEDPTGYKMWQKATINYEQPRAGQANFIQSPDAVEMGCQTESTTERISGPFPRDGLPYTTTYIPQECARSQTLTFGVSGGQVGRKLSISGLSVDYFVSSSKVR